MLDNRINHLINHSSELLSELSASAGRYNLLEIKQQLMQEITAWIQASKLKQIDAAKILSITRPRVSDLMTGKYSKFSVDSLINILERTGKTIQIAVMDSYREARPSNPSYTGNS